MAKSKIPLKIRKRHGTARQRQLALDLFAPRFPDHLTIAEIRATAETEKANGGSCNPAAATCPPALERRK